MKNYIVYNQAGKIQRTGVCADVSLLSQAGDGEFVMEGNANDAAQKIVAGKIANKTPQEIEAEQPQPIPVEEQTAHITNKQWQEVLDRISVLESEV